MHCSSRTGDIGLCDLVPVRVHAKCCKRRNPRPGIRVAAVDHAHGIVQQRRRRVQRWTVRADRSVSTRRAFNKLITIRVG